MTLPPTDHWNVRGIKGPDYKVGPRCSNPYCGKLADHAHHIWRRSRIGGDYPWVDVAGFIVANLTALCAGCHDDVTGVGGGHKAAIRFDEQHLFHWCLIGGDPGSPEYRPVGLVTPQPPTPELLATLTPDQGTGSEEGCPFCGQLTRRRPRAGALGRRRKTWLVKVPEGAEEDGAEVLDALIDNLAPLVPNADASTVGRYYVLVPVLAYAQMNARNFVETMEGIGG